MIYISYILLTLVILFFIYLEWQKSVVFHPKFFRDNSLYDERFKFLTIKTKDNVTLEGCVYTPKEFKKSLLYFGGRGQDSVGLLPKLAEIYGNVQIFTFNYRGYGKSEAKPTEEKLYSDALEVYDKVIKNYGNVSLLGYSLGSSIASYLSSKREIDKLFLIGAFTSMEELIKDTYRFRLPFLKYSFFTCKYLKVNNQETYIFLSKDDKTVLFKNSKKLKNCPKNLKKFMVLEGLNHVEILYCFEVINEIKTNL